MFLTPHLRTERDPVSKMCSLGYQTSDKVQKPGSPQWFTPSLEPFKIYSHYLIEKYNSACRILSYTLRHRGYDSRCFGGTCWLHHDFLITHETATYIYTVVKTKQLNKFEYLKITLLPP
jgi:hypothetical protein